MKAQKGDINKPVWCTDLATAEKLFGSETFRPGSTYFSMSSLFLSYTLKTNGAFIMRVADTDPTSTSKATKAAAILEAHVSEGDIPQYELDEYGNRIKERDPVSRELGYVLRTTMEEQEVQVPILDAYGNQATDNNGNPLFETEVQTAEVPITEKGLIIKWRINTETDGLDLDDLKPDATSGVYPIMALEATNEGLYGNNLAFSLFYNKDENSTTTLNTFKSVFYNFEMAERKLNSSVPQPIMSRGGSINAFAANVNETNHNMENVLTKAFMDIPGQLPYNIYTYEENMQIVGNMAAEYALNNANKFSNGQLMFIDIENYEDFEGVKRTASIETPFEIDEDSPVGWMVNIVNGVNIIGNYYDHILVDYEDNSPDAVLLQQRSYIYLTGGDDGNTSEEFVEESLIKVFRGQLPEDGSIVDKFRYPFTHIYDVGFSMDVKLELLDFLTIRDDIMLELATQVANVGQLSCNSRREDELLGEELRNRAILQQESIVFGTECCRCAIYPQAGILADHKYNGIVPFTFWSAMKHAEYGNGTVMSAQEPRGLEYSVNEYFKSYNWLNFDEIGQSRVWDKGMNYCQAADTTRIFYPALRSVYSADTSVLVDQWFVDAIVYTKHVVRQAWAQHVGRNDPSEVINSDLQTYLDTALTKLYNGKYTFDVSVYQTEEDQNRGYVRRALIRITSPATFRVLEVEVEVNRENFNEVTEEQ